MGRGGGRGLHGKKKRKRNVTGLIILRCAVMWSHEARNDNEISVNRGDVVGEIEKNIGEENMCKVS